MRYIVRLLFVLSLALALSACGGGRTPDAKLPPKVKVGKPYQVFGKTYYPRYEPNYDETGMASWYGPGFHGNKTASGERFDQDDMTAAHRTLPMPSMVRVTNLSNGKSAIVRVNDRGPFSKDRIIDLSRASAQKLGIIGSGTGRVRVQYLPQETERFWQTNGIIPPDNLEEVTKDQNPSQQDYITAVPPMNSRVLSQVAPINSVDTANLPPIKDSKLAPGVQNKTILLPPSSFSSDTLSDTQDALGNEWYILAGSFSVLDNAQKLRSKLHGVSQVEVSEVVVAGKVWYRVLIGPAKSTADAEKMLEKLFTLGIKDAKILQY